MRAASVLQPGVAALGPAFRWGIGQGIHLATHRLGWVRPFSSRVRQRVLLIAANNRISDAQIFPFHFYARELEERLSVEIREVGLDAFETAPERCPQEADVVALQTWFDITASRAEALFRKIRTHHPRARVAFFDSFAPTDLRLASLLDPHIHTYVKKHVFRDRGAYGKTTIGDTNLEDYYRQLYDLPHPPVTFDVPGGFLDKLIVGPSFSTGESFLPHFCAFDEPRMAPKSIDVHARLGRNGSDWYSRMRSHAVETVEAIRAVRAVTDFPVPLRRYRRELAASKICFSPFGYGEVAWRDYEAVLYGSLLIKPDMSHIETDPDIFRPFETYVPVAWDFSDLEDKIRHYLAHDDERRAIVASAYRVLRDHARGAAFVDQMRPLLMPA